MGHLQNFVVGLFVVALACSCRKAGEMEQSLALKNLSAENVKLPFLASELKSFDQMKSLSGQDQEKRLFGWSEWKTSGQQEMWGRVVFSYLNLDPSSDKQTEKLLADVWVKNALPHQRYKFLVSTKPCNADMTDEFSVRRMFGSLITEANPGEKQGRLSFYRSDVKFLFENCAALNISTYVYLNDVEIACGQIQCIKNHLRLAVN